MAKSDKLRDPWLVAVWPGMGNVAIIAGGYLVNRLGASIATEITSRDLFDIQHIEVEHGLVSPGQVPRNLCFEWKDPSGGRDLIVFIGEAQPTTGGYAFCHKLLEHAISRGVKRVVTFAAMATQLHPSDTPRVFGVATDGEGLREMETNGAEILGEGQISGLNGVLLAAGAEHGVPGACLLGELPFFAVGVSNPRASQAVLEVFARMSGLGIDLTELAEQAGAVEEGLLHLLEKLKRAARRQTDEDDEEDEFAASAFDTGEEDESRDDQSRKDEKPKLSPAAKRRIETLFDAVRHDRSKVVQLKEELDRHGAFEAYEDRFLDLFKKGE